MRWLLVALGLALAFLGCVQPEDGNSANRSIGQNTSATEGKQDVVVVRAYEGRFSPVELDGESLSMLEGGCSGKEKQGIRLVPAVIRGRGALLEAVYYAEYPEECINVMFLGKEYSLLSVCAQGCFDVLKSTEGNSIMLVDGVIFKDSKWRIRRAVSDTGMRRVEVYMDGSFIEVEDRKEIELFGTSGLVFRFEATEDELVFVVEATSVERQKPKPPSFTFAISDPLNRKEYAGEEDLEEGGVRIIMKDPIPAMSGLGGEAKLRPLSIPFGNSTYLTTCLEYNNETHSSKLCLGKERERVVLNPVGCEFQEGKGFVRVGENQFAFEGTSILVNDSADKIRLVICKLDKGSCSNEKMAMAMGERVYGEEDLAILWNAKIGQGWCTKSLEFSELEWEVVLEDGKDGVVLDWVGMADPKLKGVYVSKGSKAYQVLMGN
ncbi:MAG: hypothetical protein QW035_02120 [Candidatus Anstonellales archaeon]